MAVYENGAESRHEDVVGEWQLAGVDVWRMVIFFSLICFADCDFFATFASRTRGCLIFCLSGCGWRGADFGLRLYPLT